MENQPFNHVGFEHYLREGRLMACRCRTCGRLWLPPRPLCPACYHDAMAWEELSGEGILQAWTTISVGLSALASLGHDREHPYCVGIVRLKEGVSISARMVGMRLSGAEGACPDEISIGMAVRPIFMRLGEKTVLAFQPG